MAAIPSLPTLGANATLEEIRDQLAILQKTITFALTSNLGSNNAYEFGNWLVTDDSLISENGTVGFSTAVTGGDDVRIWAGNETTAIAPFRVYESGHIYVSNITIAGGSITWEDVNPPTPSDVGALPIDSGKLTNLSAIGDYLGALAQGQVIGLTDKMTYIGPFGIYSGTIGTHQLVADYALIGDAHIGLLSANKISTVGLSAERIYQPGTPQNYAVIGGTYGDLDLYRNYTNYFSIYNDTVSVSLTHYGDPFLTHNNSLDRAFPNGTWDFLNTNVLNLEVVAQFG